MRRVLRHRPSPAMVVACIALVVALGGTGYAAITLPRNSVGSRQLKPNAVTSAKVRNGALTAKDFQRSSLPRGPRGPAGPAGQSAPGAIPRVGFASRDPVAAGAGTIPVGATPVDLVGLGVPAGTAGYSSSSGAVTASGASRLTATGSATILNAAAAGGPTANVSCQLVLVGTDTKVMGNYVNAAVPSGGGFLPIAVSAGADVTSGTYDVRLQCSTADPAVQFHRGGLSVAIAAK
jgi:hypothetical protein